LPVFKNLDSLEFVKINGQLEKEKIKKEQSTRGNIYLNIGEEKKSIMVLKRS
jgi:hypothetical protein